MTDAVTAAGGTSIYSGVNPSTAKNELDGESFLKLLVAQLRYQDPSSPMDTNQMMAQTSQLASVEQLTQLGRTSLESFALQMRATATAFVGQHVSYTDAEGNTRTGYASGVSFAGPVPTVRVGDTDVTLDAISGILPPPEPEKPDSTQDPAEAADPGATPTPDSSAA
ncbi:flagellar hook assembly protein FlgD [Sanguibacter sp. HDW7]|uniref:flagellar hook assembly protein FlgD n=1 Tax=Sanguibacter sp. HDW7 TaxID=2714931 RepID=UPI00140C31CD|nr:flagellar hook capping FlgD N-terminal domain-containing protein [Sanguibacter sp. HDW7]QIK84302.1 flagellar hook capping protein [Sanguibacter sp. HDW7]